MSNVITIKPTSPNKQNYAFVDVVDSIYRAYRNMRLFNEQDEHVGHLRHIMRRHDCDTCNTLLDAIDEDPTNQHLVDEWETHRTTCGGYNTRSVVEYVDEAHGVISEVHDLKVNWDDLHQGTLSAANQ